ncbi:hypothetical protein GUITHDRAFT_106830 [Guillardia theta CCMP2712]|uniref:Uncharacterized protein n=1 Tax=Guillardia theta (strain CCMP2712) TaxID=905079 RepID=L1JGX0_GUITC|nr:hypothetical protein GUITHDRAFT_106830 [Guillardia theta CCMP2712]EKX47384.1 hypothetical protein GUITHDRAFT_106830 [Guillardia theta CCMP2712]|eukprot:XP_005834364.1 hypothetical protein GUITHDRAFT_106830 [Guillardia theta CCMP2712]
MVDEAEGGAWGRGGGRNVIANISPYTDSKAPQGSAHMQQGEGRRLDESVGITVDEIASNFSVGRKISSEMKSNLSRLIFRVEKLKVDRAMSKDREDVLRKTKEINDIQAIIQHFHEISSSKHKIEEGENISRRNRDAVNSNDIWCKTSLHFAEYHPILQKCGTQTIFVGAVAVLCFIPITPESGNLMLFIFPRAVLCSLWLIAVLPQTSRCCRAWQDSLNFILLLSTILVTQMIDRPIIDKSRDKDDFWSSATFHIVQAPLLPLMGRCYLRFGTLRTMSSVLLSWICVTVNLSLGCAVIETGCDDLDVPRYIVSSIAISGLLSIMSLCQTTQVLSTHPRADDGEIQYLHSVQTVDDVEEEEAKEVQPPSAAPETSSLLLLGADENESASKNSMDNEPEAPFFHSVGTQAELPKPFDFYFHRLRSLKSSNAVPANIIQVAKVILVIFESDMEEPDDNMLARRLTDAIANPKKENVLSRSLPLKNIQVNSHVLPPKLESIPSLQDLSIFEPLPYPKPKVSPVTPRGSLQSPRTPEDAWERHKRRYFRKYAARAKRSIGDEFH